MVMPVRTALGTAPTAVGKLNTPLGLTVKGSTDDVIWVVQLLLVATKLLLAGS
jgi:hypothetical protein